MRRILFLMPLICLPVVAAAGGAAPPPAPRLPARELNPTLTAPIETWDEAVPLGI